MTRNDRQYEAESKRVLHQRNVEAKKAQEKWANALDGATGKQSPAEPPSNSFAPEGNVGSLTPPKQIKTGGDRARAAAISNYQVEMKQYDQDNSQMAKRDREAEAVQHQRNVRREALQHDPVERQKMEKADRAYEADLAAINQRAEKNIRIVDHNAAIRQKHEYERWADNLDGKY